MACGRPEDCIEPHEVPAVFCEEMVKGNAVNGQP